MHKVRKGPPQRSTIALILMMMPHHEHLLHARLHGLQMRMVLDDGLNGGIVHLREGLSLKVQNGRHGLHDGVKTHDGSGRHGAHVGLGPPSAARVHAFLVLDPSANKNQNIFLRFHFPNKLCNETRNKFCTLQLHLLTFMRDCLHNKNL